jgi:hypothetical protein
MSTECEPADVYRNDRRTARKEHRCDACCEDIKIGDQYHVIVSVYDGTANSWKRCLRCEAIHSHLVGLGASDMWPDEKLNCGEEYEEHWNVEPPPEVAALAFKTREEMQAEARR